MKYIVLALSVLGIGLVLMWHEPIEITNPHHFGPTRTEIGVAP